MAHQNYRVEILLFRNYPKGSVIPDYEAAANGNLKEAIAEGHISPTNDAVNVELVKPVLEDHAGDDLLDAFIFAGDDRLVTDLWSAGRHIVHGGRHVARDAVATRFRAVMRGLRDRA